MKLITVLFAFQSIIFICQITNVSGQRSIYDRDGQQFGSTRYRRQKKSQRPPLQAQYYGTPNLINRDESYPNSYYNRMPENKNNAPDGVNSKRIKIDPSESGKTLHHHHQHHQHLHSLHGHHHHQQVKRRRPSYAAQTNPCYYRGRSIGSQQSQGRFFWDLNLYNVIPGTQSQYYDDDCGGYSTSAQNNYYGDSNGYGPRPPKRPYRPLPTGGLIPNTIPGISNSLSGISNPAIGISPNDGSNSIGGSSINQNPDIYDPVYDPVYENQYAAQQQQQQINMGPNLTPGQIVGGIAHTVNGVIQTLSGNSQQGQYLRNRNYRRRYRN